MNKYVNLFALAALSLFALASCRADLIKQGSTYNRDVLITDSAGANATGLASFTVTQRKAGGAYAAVTPVITEKGLGHYNVAYTAGMTDTLGSLSLVITAAGAAQTDVGDQVVAFDPNDPAALGLARLDAAVSTRLPTSGYTTPLTPSQVADAVMGGPFITIPGDHTTSGTGETLTFRQVHALSDAVSGGDNTSTAPVKGGTATVTYYLRGAAKTTANVVAVATISYDSLGNQSGRSVRVGQPFPSF